MDQLEIEFEDDNFELGDIKDIELYAPKVKEGNFFSQFFERKEAEGVQKARRREWFEQTYIQPCERAVGEELIAAELKKRRYIRYLWRGAKRATNQVLFKERLRRLKDEAVEDFDDLDQRNADFDDEETQDDNSHEVKWYLIDSNGTFCKAWDFLITLAVMYSLFVTPFILIFPHLYQWCGQSASAPASTQVPWTENCPEGLITGRQKTLAAIEEVIDVLFVIEIFFNFLKVSKAQSDQSNQLAKVAQNYLLGTFLPDCAATFPCLISGEPISLYPLKAARVVHAARITQPVRLLLSFALQNFSKKRQNDLSVFASLIFVVIFLNHLMACAWLYLGLQEPCTNEESGCVQSWVYA
jgi:hypothetical protein